MMEKILDLLMSFVKEDEGKLDLASFPLRNTTTSAHLLLKAENVVASGIEVSRMFLEKWDCFQNFVWKMESTWKKQV